jgi:hypothetical protein
VNELRRRPVGIRETHAMNGDLERSLSILPAGVPPLAKRISSGSRLGADDDGARLPAAWRLAYSFSAARGSPCGAKFVLGRSMALPARLRVLMRAPARRPAVSILIVGSTSVRRSAPLSRDLALPVGIHACKASSSLRAATGSIVVVLLALRVGLVIARGTAARRASPLRDNFALTIRIHGGESATRSTRVVLGRSGVLICRARMHLTFFRVARSMVLRGLAMVMRRRVVVEGRVAVIRRKPALAAGLLRVQLARFAGALGRAAALARDLTLPFRVHSSETSIVLSHWITSWGE